MRKDNQKIPKINRRRLFLALFVSRMRCWPAFSLFLQINFEYHDRFRHPHRRLRPLSVAVLHSRRASVAPQPRAHKSRRTQEPHRDHTRFQGFRPMAHLPALSRVHSGDHSQLAQRSAPRVRGVRQPRAHLLSRLHRRRVRTDNAVQQPHNVQLARAVRAFLSEGEGLRRADKLRPAHKPRVLGDRGGSL